MSDTTSRRVDCLVIGAGMAGASIAAHLAPHMTVAVLEAEAHAGYHTTGRSAALYSALYGNAPVRGLTRASRTFFDAPPAGFAPVPLLRARETLYLVGAGQGAIAEEFRRDADVRLQTVELDAGGVVDRLPILRRELVDGALVDASSADIDVDALHQGFLRQAKAAGATLHLGAGLCELRRDGDEWLARAGGAVWRAPRVVNAAGAWADEVAHLAGLVPLALRPLRRTAALIDVPEGLDAGAWPAVIAIDESHYFKPDAGLLLISPADETPSPPCDAQPEELDVAIAVDRFETLSGRRVARVRHQWAGLRVFSPDRTPVVGFDPAAPGFFWCAGQGGYGIQTAPALGRAAAALARGLDLPDDIAACGVLARDLSPTRFRTA
ncbi:FAD-binding oxidoreductase [Mitsuaria sp. GD03876]|uniref:NAD(P)/FAD-dependent oxidoreductase n=1 Tax=Mitsuaria sp. GD03876 TaxID=2975399 RepID=UPI002449C4B9|nr:FAD-binding oxidoreductase [Mitsuaria sp. GD03876]MDH0865235.1 FAD-binding oxidoreductase [Mitsuaria sp. GD03876]